jgi:hypothetical protein
LKEPKKEENWKLAEKVEWEMEADMVDKDRKEESVLDNVCAQPRLVESLHRRRFSWNDRKSRHTTIEAEYYLNIVGTLK